MDMTNTSSAAIEAAQILDPWVDQWKYPRALIIFLCAFLALFTLHHILNFFVDRRRLSTNSNSNSPLSIYNRAAALLRGITYRRPLHSAPALGPVILILSLLLFTLIWTFTVQPYYRPTRAGGSPPLALRSGLFAVGLTPGVYLLAFKANIITYLTGVSHEKLNVLHRWGARLLLFLGVVHTIPFIVQPLKEGGAAGLRRVWAEDVVNSNGCGALGALVVLVGGSWAPLRRYCYELFVSTHILAAVLYLGFMFWHCEDLLTSWTYLWTTAALWIASLLLRFMNTTFNSVLPCTLQLLQGDCVMITIPTTHTWTPAQHVFLRFPGLSVFDNHPFSVCSVAEDNSELNTMVVIVKPRSGFTKRLFTAAEVGPETATKVVVDGPYGGVPRAVEAFSGVVLVAGGSGITAVVGVLAWLVGCMKNGNGTVEKVRLVWVMRDRRMLAWFEKEVSEAISMVGVECRFFVTGGESDGEKLGQSVEGLQIASGRPNCGQFLEEWVEEMGERVCVIASGPKGLRNDVANSVARLQGKVNDRRNGLQELYLHTEAFDW